MICTDKILKKEACDVEYFCDTYFCEIFKQYKVFFPITFFKDCDMLYQIAFLCLRTLSVKKKKKIFLKLTLVLMDLAYMKCICILYLRQVSVLNCMIVMCCFSETII